MEILDCSGPRNDLGRSLNRGEVTTFEADTTRFIANFQKLSYICHSCFKILNKTCGDENECRA